MNNKLKITDTSKLKITKVKVWAIYFNYDNHKYLLHLSEDGYEECTKLYEIVNRKLNAICSEYGDYMVELYLTNGKLRYKECQPYNQIDIDRFIYDMTWNGFFSSKYDDEIKEKKSPIYQKKCEIERLMKEIELLERLKGDE